MLPGYWENTDDEVDAEDGWQWIWKRGERPAWICARQNEVLLCKTSDYISDEDDLSYVIWIAVCSAEEYRKLHGDSGE